MKGPFPHAISLSCPSTLPHLKFPVHGCSLGQQLPHSRQKGEDFKEWAKLHLCFFRWDIIIFLRQRNYSRNLLITGRSPPQVCKYSALKPSNENSNTGDLVNLNKQKLNIKRQSLRNSFLSLISRQFPPNSGNVHYGAINQAKEAPLGRRVCRLAQWWAHKPSGPSAWRLAEQTLPKEAEVCSGTCTEKPCQGLISNTPIKWRTSQDAQMIHLVGLVLLILKSVPLKQHSAPPTPLSHPNVRAGKERRQCKVKLSFIHFAPEQPVT